jgi:hypothetical protein
MLHLNITIYFLYVYLRVLHLRLSPVKDLFNVNIIDLKLTEKPLLLGQKIPKTVVKCDDRTFATCDLITVFGNSRLAA